MRCNVLMRWTNISAARHNTQLLGVLDYSDYIIPDGYYSVCLLNDEFFKPNGISLTQNESNGMLILNAVEKDVKLYETLAITLGFAIGDITLIKSTFDGDTLPDLVPYKELCIHLDQISTTGNIQLESPSTLLRSIPVKNEKYNSGRKESFSTLQNKKLKRGIISDLKISVLDVKHQPVHIGYLSVTLHIINNG